MNFPSELKYSKDHEWLKIEGNTGLVGITEFAQKELGDIVYLDVTSVGKSLKQNDVFGTVEAVKTVSDLFLPVDAKIIEFNKELEAHPEYVNSDPYGKGWVVKIEISGDVSALLDSGAYKQLIGV